MTYLLCALIKPVGDVCASSQRDGVALGLKVVVVYKLRQVVNLVEERDPAVIVGVVRSDLLGCVEVAQFVRSGVALGVGFGERG